MKKKYLTSGILIGAFLVCAVAVCVFVRLFPLLRAAQAVKRVMSAKGVDFEINVTLNEGCFSEGQEQFLKAVSWMLEVDQSACMTWQIRGSVSQGQGYARIFCEGLDGAVTNVAFSEDGVWVDVKTLYGAVQDNFASAHPLLGSLLPDWKYSDYISLEQLEEIFQVDIRGMYLPKLPQGASGRSLWQNIMVLKQLEREKDTEDGGQWFKLGWEGYQIVFGIGGAGKLSEVPDAEAGEAAPGQEIFIEGTDQSGSQPIASYTAAVRAAAAKEMPVPDSVMEEDEIEQFKKLWELVEGMQGQFGKER